MSWVIGQAQDPHLLNPSATGRPGHLSAQCGTLIVQIVGVDSDGMTFAKVSIMVQAQSGEYTFLMGMIFWAYGLVDTVINDLRNFNVVSIYIYKFFIPFPLESSRGLAHFAV